MKASILRSALVGLAFLPTLHAQRPSEERIWTGMNGVTFRGTYSRTLAQGGKIEFLSAEGKVLAVAFGNLSEMDQELIRKFEGKGGAEEQKFNNPNDFKKLPLADRKLITDRWPIGLSGTDMKSTVDAIWVSLLWWNTFEVVPIPRKGDMERKAEWLHEELTRHLEKSARSLDGMDGGKQGVENYFEKRLENIGTCKVTVLKNYLSPEELTALAGGNTAVVLNPWMSCEDRPSSTVCALLETMGLDGSFAIHMFGKRFTGKIAPATGNKSENKARSYELILDDQNKIPDLYRISKPKFFINMSATGDTLVLEPFLYKTPGESVPIWD